MIVFLIPISIVILFLGYNRFFRANWKNGLSCEIAFEDTGVTEGDRTEVVQILTNRKRLPLLFLQVKFTTARGLLAADYPNATVSDKLYVSDVFSLRSYERVTRRISFKCVKRGYYVIDSADLIVTNLMEGKKDYMETEQSSQLYVYPGTLPYSMLARPFERIMGDIQRRSFVHPDPFTFRGVRDYMPFDPMKDISQKMTARSGELKVNLRDSATTKQMCLILNLEDPQSLFDPLLLEQGIRLVMTLVTEFFARGIRVSVYTNGVDVLTGEPFRALVSESAENLRIVAQGLARIDLSLPSQSFADFIDGIIYSDSSADQPFEMMQTCCIISTSTRNDIIESASRLAAGRGGLMWLCPVKSYMTPGVRVPGIEFFTIAAD